MSKKYIKASKELLGKIVRSKSGHVFIILACDKDEYIAFNTATKELNLTKTDDYMYENEYKDVTELYASAHNLLKNDANVKKNLKYLLINHKDIDCINDDRDSALKNTYTLDDAKNAITYVDGDIDNEVYGFDKNKKLLPDNLDELLENDNLFKNYIGDIDKEYGEFITNDIGDSQKITFNTFCKFFRYVMVMYHKDRFNNYIMQINYTLDDVENTLYNYYTNKIEFNKESRHYYWYEKLLELGF